MWTKQTVFRRAHAGDIPAIMEIERQPGYEQLVGRWSEVEHVRNITSPGYLYLVHDDPAGELAGFAALSGLGDRSGDVLVNRLIVRTPGQGIGTRFMTAIVETVFEGSPARRIWLRVLPDNQRALRLYINLGFREERILKGGGLRPDGVRVDLLAMAMTRSAWEGTPDPDRL